MKKAWLMSVVLPGAFLFTSAEAAKLIRIDDSNFNQYLTQTEKYLNSVNHEGRFILDKTITLSNGTIKKRYIQYYKNVPVFSSLITSTDLVSVQQYWWGSMLTDISADLPDTRPSFSTAEAINKAKTMKGLAQSTPTTMENATLYVMANKKTHVAQLVYLVSFFVNTDEPQRPFFMLNAKDGELIDQWNGLTTKDGQGPGGNTKTGQYYYGKDFSSMIIDSSCQMTNTNADTYNLNGQTSGGVLFKFSSCPNTSPAANTYKQINGAFSPLNDAHYFGGVVFDMYEKWYNMQPLGDGEKLKIQVHFGQNYENAFWDGQQMTFGDGGASLYPLTALDVMGHEVSHGVTEKNSKMNYQHQSGGMNEAFSDMAGETAEYYMESQAGKENDWLIGSTIMKNQQAMRYFANPSQDGQSIENASDYNDSLDVHYTSGVYNKAFYTLATKSNWGIRKAFEVFLNANRVYWTADSTFDEGACGVSKVASDLGYEVSDVVSSFKVVGVNAGCTTPAPTPSQEIEIQNGHTISNIQLDNGVEHRFVIKVPALNRYPYMYKYLYINLTDGKNTVKNLAELFVRYDAEGISGNKAPKIVRGKDEMFYIQFPYAGFYHILLKGKAPATLSLVAIYGN